MQRDLAGIAEVLEKQEERERGSEINDTSIIVWINEQNATPFKFSRN